MIGCADPGAMLTGEQQGIVCDRARLAMAAGLRRSAQRDGQNWTPSGQLCAALDVPADGDAVGRSAQGVWRDRSNPCRRTIIPRARHAPTVNFATGSRRYPARRKRAIAAACPAGYCL
jgi:hypothetical protein